MKFDQKSFDENDEKGKDLLKSFLITKGHDIIENETSTVLTFSVKRTKKNTFGK